MTSAPPDVPVTRGYKKRERTRRQLVASAIDVIAERGEAFSASDVTARAEMSTGTFYNYFEDRDALIESVVPEVLAAFAADSAALVEESDPAVRFATITARALAHAGESPAEVRAILRLDAAQRLIADGRAMDFLRADLAAGVASGRFTADVDGPAVDVVVGALLFAARRIVSEPVADDYPGQVVAQLLRSLGVDPGEAEVIACHAVDERQPR